MRRSFATSELVTDASVVETVALAVTHPAFDVGAFDGTVSKRVAVETRQNLRFGERHAL